MSRIVRLLSVVAAAGLPLAPALAQTPAVQAPSVRTPDVQAPSVQAPAVQTPPDAAPQAPPSGSLGAQLAAVAPPPVVSAALAAPKIAAPDPASAPVARRVIDAAGAFDAYLRQASAIGPHFADGAAVAKAVGAGAAYEPRQLSEGAAAYTALVALQDPAFVEAVREAGAGPDGAALADRLLAEPQLVLDLPGAEETAARAAVLVGVRGSALEQSGAAVRKAAYSIQREPWSKGPVKDAGERLNRVKLASATPGVLGGSDTQALMASLVGLRRAGVSAIPAGYAPTGVTARGLAVAALAVLGRGGEDHAQEVGRLLADPQGADCLKMAKLNLYQCLAVAGPHYEDMFCLGQHALADTGRCMVASAGWSGPLQAAPVLTAARAALPPAAPASVAVPLALTALDGPERAAAYADAAEPGPPVRTGPPARPAYEVARADVPSFDSTPRRAVDPYADEDRGPPPGPSLRDQGYDDWGRPLTDPYAASAPYDARDRGYADPGYYAHAGYGGRPGSTDR